MHELKWALIIIGLVVAYVLVLLIGLRTVGARTTAELEEGLDAYAMDRGPVVPGWKERVLGPRPAEVPEGHVEVIGEAHE